MAFFQLSPDDYADESVANVWRINMPAVRLFTRVGTQWRVSAGGAYGLDYGVLFHLMDRMGLTPERYLELEEEIRVLESAALDAMHADD